MLNKQHYSVGRGLCGFLNERQFISLKSLSALHLYFTDLIFTFFCEIFLPDDGKQGLVWGIMHVCPRRALIVTFASSLAPFVFVARLGRAENPQCSRLWTAVIWLTNNKPPNCTQRVSRSDRLDGNDEAKRNIRDRAKLLANWGQSSKLMSDVLTSGSDWML